MKIAICVPHHGDVKAKFALCLANLVAETTRGTIRLELSIDRAEVRTFFEQDGPVDFKRTRLVRRARKWGAEYILFVDSDQTFPPDALLRLLRRRKPVIGCNYVTRYEPVQPTAIDGDNRRLSTTRAKAEADQLEEVAALGLGFCLLHTHVFEIIGKDAVPFLFTFDSNGEIVCGEDVHFFNVVRAAGLAVFLDHAVSWDIGHIAEAVRTHSEDSNLPNN
jgi:hypothetical protein